jgi:hypothetical protein
VHTVVRSGRRQQENAAEQSQGEVVLLPEHLQSGDFADELDEC